MIEIVLRDLRPGDGAWVILRHAALYAAEEGYDPSFEGLVAGIVADFLRDHDPLCEHGWIAGRGEHRLGNIFVVRAAEGLA